MATPSNIKIGASSGSDAFVKFNDGTTDKVILKHDDSNNHFGFFKDISGTSTEVMRFDSNGNIDFISSVKFSGGSSVVNTETLSIQDQQLEIGLKDSFELSSVNISGNDFTFTVSNPRSDGGNTYSTGTYVYFQNVKNSSNTYISQFQDAIAVTASNSTSFTVTVSGVTDTIDFNHVPVSSELVTLTQNTGIQILAKDSSNNLVRGALKYKNDTDKSLQLENNAGSIDIGSENDNFEITIGESGSRDIKIGSSNAQNLTLDSSQNIKIGVNQSCPVDFNATTLDIDASGALTLDSATSISIGTNADKPLDIDASTLDIDASSVTNIKTTGANMTISTVTSGDMTQSSAGILDIDAGGALTLDSATSISIGTNADKPLDIDASTLDIDASSVTNIKTTGADMTISTVTSGDMTQSSAGILDIDAGGALTLDSATSISIGTNADKPLDIDASTLDIDASNTTNIKTTGANMTISTVTSGNMVQSSAGTLDVDSVNALSINSSGGVINIGTDNVSQNINIGTDGARTITVGKNGVGTFQVDSENVVFTNSTQFSDINLKENLLSLDNSLEKINNLNGYYYNWIKDETKKQHIGLIAQEVETQFPMLITEQENGYKTVNYVGMIPVLLECIKTQNKKINVLNDKINELSKI